MEYKMSVREFIGMVKSGSIDVEDFYSRLKNRMEVLNKKYNLLVSLGDFKPQKTPDVKGKVPYLPISVKDCICTKGLQSSAGSRILEGYVPPFDATCIKKAKEEGGVVVGKTNQDEFGFGTFSVNSGFGTPKNPIDPDRSCGGSSGGSAGLVKALEYPHVSIAESTGGSISCPASFCGVAGFTPTYGMVSRHGLIDYSNSLDKIGVIAKKAWDIGLMLSVISGRDEKDATSMASDENNYAAASEGLETEKLRIGVPQEYFENVDYKIYDLVWTAIKKLESSGAKYEKISLGTTKYALACYYIIACSEASTNLARFCGMRYGKEGDLSGSFDEYFSAVRAKYFGTEAKRRILLGTFSRMAGYREQYYLKALKVRSLVIQDFKQAFKKHDVLIAPTMPMTAPKFAEIEKLTPAQQYMMDVLTVGPNLAGIPHLSIPCGEIGGMPVGLHIMGDHMCEEKVLQVGGFLEKTLI